MVLIKDHFYFISRTFGAHVYEGIRARQYVYHGVTKLLVHLSSCQTKIIFAL